MGDFDTSKDARDAKDDGEERARAAGEATAGLVRLMDRLRAPRAGPAPLVLPAPRPSRRT